MRILLLLVTLISFVCHAEEIVFVPTSKLLVSCGGRSPELIQPSPELVIITARTVPCTGRNYVEVKGYYERVKSSASSSSSSSSKSSSASASSKSSQSVSSASKLTWIAPNKRVNGNDLLEGEIAGYNIKRNNDVIFVKYTAATMDFVLVPAVTDIERVSIATIDSGALSSTELVVTF